MRYNWTGALQDSKQNKRYNGGALSNELKCIIVKEGRNAGYNCHVARLCKERVVVMRKDYV